MGWFSVSQDDIDAVIAALEEFHANSSDPSARAVCIGKISPTIKSLACAKQLEPLLHKLINEGNADRAAKLVAAVPRRKKLFG